MDGESDGGKKNSGIEGQFKVNKGRRAVIFAGLLICAGLLARILWRQLSASGGRAADLLPLTLIGGSISALVAVCFTLLLLFNRKARIRVENRHISARFGWNQRLECDVSDVEYAGMNSGALVLQVRGRRNRCRIGGLANLTAVYAEIQLQRPLICRISSDRQDLLARMKAAKAARKLDVRLVFVLLVLLILNIFLLGMLTEWKEDTADFDAGQRIAAWVIGGLEILVLAAAFGFAVSSGKSLRLIEWLREDLIHAAILQTPLLPGAVRSVWTDFDRSARLTVFDCPGTSDRYFTVETVEPDYTLTLAQRSPIPAGSDERAGITDGLQEITDCFTL